MIRTRERLGLSLLCYPSFLCFPLLVLSVFRFSDRSISYSQVLDSPPSSQCWHLTLLRHSVIACRKGCGPTGPHDSPTNRFLHPDDKSISKQQKLRWYQAIKELLNLDIAQAVEEGDNNEVRAVINDAVRELRNRLWKSPVAERVNLHNNDYGFARNFTGFQGIWLSLALVSLVGCWINYGRYDGSIFWAIVSTAIAVGTLVLAYILPNYVRQKANHYAESFFAAVVKLRNIE